MIEDVILVTTVITIIVHVAARVYDASEWRGGGGARALNWRQARQDTSLETSSTFGARERCTEETPRRCDHSPIVCNRRSSPGATPALSKPSRRDTLTKQWIRILQKEKNNVIRET